MEHQESTCSRNTEEVLGAAQQLMQLSNEGDSCCNVVTAENNNKKRKHGGAGGGGGKEEEEEVDQKRSQIEASIWSKIEEIFGKEEEEEGDCDFICRPKKRRFRSIQSIYMNTKPIFDGRFSGKGIVGT